MRFLRGVVRHSTIASKTGRRSSGERNWQRQLWCYPIGLTRREVTGNTGEGTGETGTVGWRFTGKGGEGIGTTGFDGTHLNPELDASLRFHGSQ